MRRSRVTMAARAVTHRLASGVAACLATRAPSVMLVSGVANGVANEMNGVLGYDSALVRLCWAWANEMNFVMNHVAGAGSIARPVDQQSSAITVPRMPPVSSCIY